MVKITKTLTRFVPITKAPSIFDLNLYYYTIRLYTITHINIYYIQPAARQIDRYREQRDRHIDRFLYLLYLIFGLKFN